MFFEKALEFSVGISVSISFVAKATITMEEFAMVSIISMIGAMAGTTLLGQVWLTRFQYRERMGAGFECIPLMSGSERRGGSIPPLPRHPHSEGMRKSMPHARKRAFFLLGNYR